jgi:hypothetical protein
MEIINKTDVATGTYIKAVPTASLVSIALQYDVMAGEGNIIEFQFWGTVYPDADESIDDDWVNMTQDLCGVDKVSVTGDTKRELLMSDHDITLAQIKVKCKVTAATPDNYIKIGWNSDR